MINLIINNKKIQVKPNTTVLQACELAKAEVPRFCYHDKLAVAGNCRMCLVEVEKSPKPVVSCAMPVMEGMRIYTNTPLVKKARETVLEFLLINHPLDCPICDQGGECDLQDQTLAYGSDKSRFFEFKRGVEDKECGPIIKTIMTRCIHCTRCVRFAEEISGTNELGVIGRGGAAEIGTYINGFIKTELSGNLIDLCPVGALTSKPYAFQARNWELKRIESIDFLDAICSNIVVNTRNNSIINKDKFIDYPKDEILRVLPRLNETINDEWISDKTRFAFDGVRKQRLESPSFFLQSDQTICNWNHIFDYINFFINENLSNSFNLKKNKNLVGLYGQLSDLESIYFYFQFLTKLGSSDIQYNNSLLSINNDIPLFYRFNSTINNLDKGDVFLLIGTNTRFEGSMINTRLRKQYVKRQVKIGVIGNPVDLTYPYSHLGSSTKTLLQISEGKHFFCRELRNAKQPIIIYGTEFLQRQDAQAINNLIRFISINNYVYTNMLSSSVGLCNGLELGISLGVRSKLYLNNKNNNINTLFLLNTNKINKKKWVNFDNKIKKTTVFMLDSHLNNHNYRFADFLLPIKTPYEKISFFSNIEGRVQKSYKVISGLKNSRNSVFFFKALAKYLNIQNTQTQSNIFSNHQLIKENPFIAKINKIPYTFNLKLLKYKESNNRIYLSNFTPLINNFYMTDSISQNSSTMAECSLFLNTRTNYLKKNKKTN